KTRITAMGGTYDSYRVELDASNFFDHAHRFGYRLVGVYAYTDGVVRDRPEKGNGLRAINPSLSWRSQNGWYVWGWAALMRDQLRKSTFGVPALPTDASFSFPSRPALHGAPLYEVAYNHMLTNLQFTNDNLYEAGLSKSFTLGP